MKLMTALTALMRCQAAISLQPFGRRGVEKCSLRGPACSLAGSEVMLHLISPHNVTVN